MAAKIWVDDVLDSYFDPEGTLDGLIAILEGTKSAHPDHKDFRIEKIYNGYDESDTFKIVAKRLETDKEFEKRMKKIEKEREKKEKEDRETEEAEKKLYEKLKKKFGKVS